MEFVINLITSAFGTSSDYVGFLNLGVPSSGIFTGADAPQDPCYHQACDDIDNIHWEALTINTKAAANVATQFALSLEDVPRRDPPAKPVKRKGWRRRGEAELLGWESPITQMQVAKPCSHEHDHDNLH